MESYFIDCFFCALFLKVNGIILHNVTPQWAFVNSGICLGSSHINEYVELYLILSLGFHVLDNPWLVEVVASASVLWGGICEGVVIF